MPPPSWATDEQSKWLTARIPDFIEAQRKNAMEDFFKVTYTDRFHCWELEDPTAAELAEQKGDREAAVSQKTKAMRKVGPGLVMMLQHMLTYRC